MYNRDYRDIIGGALISATGLAAAYIAVTDMDVGDLGRIGPGMFPAIVGVLLVLFGVGILVPALPRTGHEIHVKFRPLIAISASILVFCLMIERLGILPSIMLMTIVASRADRNASPRTVAITGIVLVALAILIFKLGLGLSTPIISLPW